MTIWYERSNLKVIPSNGNSQGLYKSPTVYGTPGNPTDHENHRIVRISWGSINLQHTYKTTRHTHTTPHIHHTPHSAEVLFLYPESVSEVGIFLSVDNKPIQRNTAIPGPKTFLPPEPIKGAFFTFSPGINSTPPPTYPPMPLPILGRVG